MKKIVLILLLSIAPLTNLYAQDPGFGDEGGGDAQDGPVAPISDNITEAMAAGILIAGYFFLKRKKAIKN